MNLDNEYYVRSKIVAGRFPKSFDTKLFCNQFDLGRIMYFFRPNYTKKMN